MIKANELRIWNWVSIYDDGKWTLTQVHGFCNASERKKIDGFSSPFILFSFGSIVLRYGYDDTENDFLVKPISITPEILEKCGFESGKETNINGLIQYDFWETKNIPHLHRWLLYKDGEYIIYKNNILIGRAYIKYLHQLQNLYFAVTGEELNINL